MWLLYRKIPKIYLSVFCFSIGGMILYGIIVISIRIKQKRMACHMERPQIIHDKNENKIVLIPDIVFTNKQNIDRNDVEAYLERFAGG